MRAEDINKNTHPGSMAYRIPSDDEVARSIDDCLARCPRMRSQRELCDAVAADLAYRDPLFRVGADRVRRIGIERGLLNLEISYAASNRPVGDLCPCLLYTSDAADD